VVLFRLGRLQEALPDCERSVALAPDDAAALRFKAYLLLKLERYNEAFSDFDISVRKEPMNADGLFGRGSARIALGDRSAGEADIAAAMALDPQIAQNFEGETNAPLRAELRLQGRLPLLPW
jgi:tetratricopeptide (TPR) repeat protein